MNIQKILGGGAFALCTLFTSSIFAVSLDGLPEIDNVTHGNWGGTYGDCYNVLPQASPRACVPEVEIGPDFEGPNPEQYWNPEDPQCKRDLTAEREFKDAVCIKGKAPGNFDVRVFVNTPEVDHAYAWGFNEPDSGLGNEVLPGTSQENACMGEEGHSAEAVYASTFDSDRFARDPLSGELKITQGGDARIAYYFLTEKGICRSQKYKLYVNNVAVPLAEGEILDFSSGKYVVFNLKDIPDGALVRLDTQKIDTTPACGGLATGTAVNSHLSGIFVDGTRACAEPPPSLGCRFTGGLKDVFEDNHYRAGGQAGANTALQPQPKGEWTHRQQKGPAGKFTFHGGTASAPEGSEIDVIRCSDPGGCKPSGDKPSPAKQLDFDGIGTFKNIGKKNGGRIPDFVKDEGNTVMVGHGNKNFDGTFHWFEVNIDDLGEPGNTNPKKNPGDSNPEICPANGFGENGDEALANCSCSDFYRITIYDGVEASDVTKNPDGSIDKSEMNTTDVIYEVQGYIDGGNLQLHHLTGFDLK